MSHSLSGWPAVTDSAVKMVLSFMLILSLFLFGEREQHLPAVQGFIFSELLRRQRHKGFPTEASQKKGAAHNIIGISVFQPEEAIRLQTGKLAAAEKYKRHGILVGICGLNVPADNLLHGMQGIRDLPGITSLALGCETAGQVKENAALIGVKAISPAGTDAIRALGKRVPIQEAMDRILGKK